MKSEEKDKIQFVEVEDSAVYSSEITFCGDY